MANLSITPGSVLRVSGNVSHVTAGETITAGMPVFKDTADSNEYKKCDTTTAAKSLCAGIALNGASDGQPLTILTDGVVTIGATVGVGTWYGVSDTAGAVCPIADNGSGDYGCVIGVATTTGNIQLSIQTAGVAIPA